MDKDLLQKLKGAEISLQEFYKDEHNRENRTLAIFINPACGVTLDKNDLAKVTAHLQASGVSVDVGSNDSSFPYLPTNQRGLTLNDRGLTTVKAKEAVQHIRDVFKDIDANIEELTFNDDIPSPSCNPLHSKSTEEGNSRSS